MNRFLSLFLPSLLAFAHVSSAAFVRHANEHLKALEERFEDMATEMEALKDSEKLMRAEISTLKKELLSIKTEDGEAKNKRRNLNAFTELTDVVSGLEDRLACIDSNSDSDTLIFSGCNVRIQNNKGQTESKNGRGNLIIGYDETLEQCDRSGSHNLVLGKNNQYSSYGGIVAGESNVITNKYASVLGGNLNSASGQYSIVSGGFENTATGSFSSVIGGAENKATGYYSSVSGGYSNEASGGESSVSGGRDNKASGIYSSVAGGIENEANGKHTSVSGGKGNNPTSENESILG